MPFRSLEILRGVFPELSGLEDARPVTRRKFCDIQHQSVFKGVANRKANGQKKAVLGALPQFKSVAERLRAFRLKVGFKPTLLVRIKSRDAIRSRSASFFLKFGHAVDAGSNHRVPPCGKRHLQASQHLSRPQLAPQHTFLSSLSCTSHQTVYSPPLA